MVGFAQTSAATSPSATAPVEMMDPLNPTCPKNLNWSNNKTMQFTLVKKGKQRVLLAEGAVDDGMLTRLQGVLKKDSPIDEIWIRSPGGNAWVGNEAGKLIRKIGIPTRIPAGWACFSACNFVFMGGPIRIVDPGGEFVVHMFTHADDRAYIREQVAKGTQSTVDMIGNIEQDSAMLVSDDNDFLIRMGVSRKLLTEVMYKQKALKYQGNNESTRRCLTQDEIYKYNVANVH